MGRYDRDSRRYTKTRKSGGLSVTVAGLLVFAAAVGGFLARPYVEENTRPIRDLLGLIDNPPALPAPTPATTNSVKATEAAPTLEPLQAPPAPIILPELASSDGEFRKAVTSSAPELAQWLNGDGLIRKFMTIANDISQSQRINKHFEFLKLPQRFIPSMDSAGLVMDVASQRRYDRLATAIAEADTAGLITTYQIFKPLLQQVYQEFSYPDEFPLEAMLRKAGAEIIAAPIIEGPIPLTQTSLRYQFADPQLEALNPVRKQMLRMGPENTRLIQEKIKALLEKLAEPPGTP